MQPDTLYSAFKYFTRYQNPWYQQWQSKHKPKTQPKFS